MKMAEKGYWVYDFALPMLLLHGIMSGRTDRLIHWLNICPRKQFTTLDTHDGIGVVDVVHLLEMDEIDLVRERVAEKTKEAQKHLKLPGGMMKVSGGKQVLYQLGTTYYSALDENDDAYLLARAVQFFTPGIPQVYYVGLLAGANDIESLKLSGEPRGINRHNYTREEIEEEIKRPVLQKLYELMKFRNTCPAFDGDMLPVENSDDGKLKVTWQNGSHSATLNADFKTKMYNIIYTDGKTVKTL
jgi:sucrose phosphorylase